MREQILEQFWKEHLSKSNQEKWKIRDFIQRKIHKLQISKKLFKLFETHLKACESDGSMVIVEKKLSSDSLQALIVENNACAIHVPGFCSSDIAESLSKRAIEEYTHWKLGGTINTDMFYAGGSIPKEVADRSWADFHRYFGEWEDFICRQRAMSEGSWAVDRLRLELDEAWPSGTYLGRYLGRKLRPAIMRIMHEENDFFSASKHGLIHADDFPKLKSSWGTFSANIYLKIPEEGGELYIWSINLKKTKGIRGYLSAQILAMIMNQGYVFDMQPEILKLLPPPHIIKPKSGDLVILHSGRPHSVAPVTKGVRVTNQSFIHARGQVPLTIWS